MGLIGTYKAMEAVGKRPGKYLFITSTVALMGPIIGEGIIQRAIQKGMNVLRRFVWRVRGFSKQHGRKP